MNFFFLPNPLALYKEEDFWEKKTIFRLSLYLRLVCGFLRSKTIYLFFLNGRITGIFHGISDTFVCTHFYTYLQERRQEPAKWTIHKCKLRRRRHTNTKTLDVPEVQHFGRHFFGGEEVKNPQLAQILNQKECGMLSILFNLLSQFFFGLLSRWLLFFVFVCPPFNKKWRKKIWKKKLFSAFRWTNFWPIFREEEIVFWINLLWQYIWLRLGCRYCTVLTEASLFFVEIFFWNGELFLQDVWYSFHPLFPSLKISPCTPQ